MPAPGTSTSTTRRVALAVRAICAGSWESGGADEQVPALRPSRHHRIGLCVQLDPLYERDAVGIHIVPVSETATTKHFERFHWWLILLWGILATILGIMFLATPARP